jgi:hypothetical protein
MKIGKRPNREIAVLGPHLGSAFSGFLFRGTTFLHAPVADILWGFTFEARPGHGKSKWLHAFGMPLAIPREYVVLSFGSRIPNGLSRGHDAYPVSFETEQDVIATARVMETEGLEVLSRWSTVSAFRQSLAKPKPVFSIHEGHAAAVLAASAGDLAEAARHILECKAYIKAYESHDLSEMRRYNSLAKVDSELRPWAKGVLESMMPLLEPCVAGDQAGVRALLSQWRAHTISHLGIEDICLPD